METNGWVLTDDDSYQWIKEEVGSNCDGSDSYFSVIQKSLTSCLDEKEDYEVVHGRINMAMALSENSIDETVSVINSFGYDSIEEIQKEYGRATYQIVAECLAESLSEYALALTEGSCEECNKFINRYIKEN